MKLKYIFLLFSCFLVGISCQKITNLSPIDSFTDQSYWRNVEDLERYTNAFYGMLPGPTANGDIDCDNRLPSDPNSLLFDKVTVDRVGNWGWGGIRQINFFMARYQKASGAEADINAQVAVARYFRALNYFDKVKTYGKVPWYDKDLMPTDKELLFADRNEVDFVVAKIIEDLEFAIQWLPEKQAVEDCALHKDAARAELSRLCLYFGTYKKYHKQADGSLSSQSLLEKCVKVSEDLINSGLYAIVKGDNAGASMVPEEGYPMFYQNQFVQNDLKDNKEAILYRHFQDGVATHGLGRNNGCGYTKDFVESFLCTDGKPIGVSNLYQGDEYLDQEMQNRDPRMYQIIDNIHRPYTIKAGVVTVHNSAEEGKSGYSAPDVSASSSVTGYANVKWQSANPDQWIANASTFDWFLYRYAEVLLNYAEAKCELGQINQDILNKTINAIRDRVGMPHLNMEVGFIDPNARNYGYEISPLLREIRRERRIELVGEGFRMDDIARWKAYKLFENPKTMLGIRVTDFVKSLYKEGTFGGDKGRTLVEYEGKTYIRPYSEALDAPSRRWSSDDKRMLWPLSKNVLLINPNLQQNPGWE